MKLWVAATLTVGAMIMLSGSVVAHHSFAGEFDNSSSVTLNGVVTGVEIINPHSWIYLDVTTDGAVERWALEGPGPTQIQRRGFDLRAIKTGDEIAVCGYLARSDVSPTKRDPATGHAARKLSAAVLTTADRGRFPWSNYRQGKCELDK
jgi:hypothetical protein